jgi:hypothetical protein
VAHVYFRSLAAHLSARASAPARPDLLDAIVQHGGFFTQHDANEGLKHGTQEGTRTPHPTQGLLRELVAYCHHRQDAFTCPIYLIDPRTGTVECSILVNEEEMILSATNSTLECSVEGAAYVRWLAFVELFYEIWTPIFGYLSDGPEWGEQDIFGLKVNRLYELNLFGPEYVAQIGREKFQGLKVGSSGRWRMGASSSL